MSSPSHPCYRRPCGWLDLADDGVRRPELTGDCHYDAIVVGAGYTGLGIGRRLAENNPQQNIAVLEADCVGGGSPGRNSGFVIENAFTASSPDKAGALYQLYRKAHADLMQVAGMADDSSSQHMIKAAATKRGETALSRLGDFLQRSGQPWEPLDASALYKLTGSSYYRAAIKLKGNRLLNPALLIRNIADHMPANIALYENSPVLAIEPCSTGWVARTAKGTIKAPKLFLANNAFIKGLGIGRPYSVTIYTYAGITAPLAADEQQQVLGQGQWGLLPAHRLGTTFRTTDDGRLLVRGMYGYEKEGCDEIPRLLQQSLVRRFPEIKSAGQLTDWWGGTTSLTLNGAPLWGEIKPGLFVSAGCNGVGVVKGWLLGQALADLSAAMNKIDIPGLFGRPQWMPPEPFRKPGFLIASKFEKKLAGAEI
ncbi:NAD(P)/FAD-dependent oxidoreductase [Spongorhabdus nitratireducens]